MRFRVVATLFFGFLCALPAAAQRLDSSLVARYTFEDDFTDETANGYDGRPGGNPAFVAGPVGKALDLDGVDDSVLYGGIPDATFGGDFTIAWFVRYSAFARYSLISKRGACTLADAFDIRAASSRSDLVGFELTNGRTSFVARAQTRVNAWVHLAAVRRGNVLTLYADGVPGAELTMPSLDAPNLGGVVSPLGLGSSPCIGSDGTVRPNAQVDELRVYSRALGQGEIETLASMDDESRSGGMTVSPTTATPGGKVRLTLPGFDTTGKTCTVTMGDRTSLGTVTGTGRTGINTVLTVPANTAAGTQPITLSCTTAIRIATVVGRASLRVVPPIVVSMTPASGYQGRRIAFTATGLVGPSFELAFAGKRILGPTPVRGNSTSGYFIVPTGDALSTRVDVRSTTGTLANGIGSAAFNRTAKPAFNVALSNTTVPPTSTTRQVLSLGGRLQAADGAPQTRVANMFFRGDDGRVVPLGMRDVTVNADGTFQTPAELPSDFTQDGYVARGGTIFYTMTWVDEGTGATMNKTFEVGRIENSIADFGDSAEAEITVRKEGGQPLANALVEVGNVDPSLLTDPNSADAMTLMGGRLTQLTGQTRDYGNLVANGLGACPLSIARGYTDANGVFKFKISRAAAQAYAASRQMQAGVCEFTKEQGTGEEVTCVVNTATPASVTVYTGHLGYGDLVDGIVLPRVLPAEFRLDVETPQTLGQYFNPNTNQPLNSASQPWRATVTVEAIDPALTVVPWKKIGPNSFADPLSAYQRYQRTIAGGVSRYVLGSGFDLRSASPSYTVGGPVLCDENPNDICVVDGTSGYEVHYIHDPVIAGTFQSGSLVFCAGDTFDCQVPARSVPLTQAEDLTHCGISGYKRYVAVVPKDLTPVSGRVRGRMRVNSFFSNGGAIGQQLSGKANIQIGMTPLPEWFNGPVGPGRQLKNRIISVLSDGRTSFTADENMTGGAKNDRSATSSEFSEVNLPAKQTNDTENQRKLTVLQRSLNEAPTYSAFAAKSENTVANNTGDSVENSQSSPDVTRKETIFIDTGEIPLFRYTWGVPPIADATLGADFWLKAGMYQTMTKLEPSSFADPPDILYITEPFSNLGIDIFFDLDILFGLVSAEATASASVYLSNQSKFENGNFSVVNPCFGFNLDLSYEVCALVCGGDTVNLISVFEPNTTACRLSTTPVPIAGKGIGERFKPTVGASLAIGPDGYGAIAYVGDDNVFGYTPWPMGAAAADRDVAEFIPLEPSGNSVTSQASAYYSSFGGLAIWSHTPGTPGSVEAATQASHLKYARLSTNGAPPSYPQTFTPPGSGDGNVALAGCPDYRDECPDGGQLTAAWVRRIGATYGAHHYAVMWSRYTASGGWTTPARIDAAQGQNSDMQPTVVYWGSTPVVFFVRKPTPGTRQPETRVIAYRMLDGSSPVRLASGLPSGVSSPSATTRYVQDGAFSRRELVLAYVRNVDTVQRVGKAPAFAGPQNALNIAKGSCGNGTCTFTNESLRDRYGRDFRVERPTVSADNQGRIAIGARGLAFGRDLNGNRFRVGDPMHMISGQGAPIMLRAKLDGSPASIVNLGGETAGGVRPALAFDPVLDMFVTVSQPINVGALIRASEMKHMKPATRAKASVAVASSNAAIAMMSAAPDFQLDPVTPPGLVLPAGGTIAIPATVSNLGTPYTLADATDLQLVATWDAPAGATADAAVIALPVLAEGEIANRVLNVPVPATFKPDEVHVLHVTVRAADALGEADTLDNAQTVIFNTMPVPEDILVSTEAGQPAVFLEWKTSPANDARIAGYRVMLVAADGTRVPLGSTPVPGFVDAAARYGEQRRYVVTSYSANGVESSESEIAVGESALPAIDQPGGNDPLFSDSFE